MQAAAYKVLLECVPASERRQIIQKEKLWLQYQTQLATADDAQFAVEEHMQRLHDTLHSLLELLQRCVGGPDHTSMQQQHRVALADETIAAAQDSVSRAMNAVFSHITAQRKLSSAAATAGAPHSGVPEPELQSLYKLTSDVLVAATVLNLGDWAPEAHLQGTIAGEEGRVAEQSDRVFGLDLLVKQLQTALASHSNISTRPQRKAAANGTAIGPSSASDRKVRVQQMAEDSRHLHVNILSKEYNRRPPEDIRARCSSPISRKVAQNVIVTSSETKKPQEGACRRAACCWE